jgi:hypothetical protein
MMDKILDKVRETNEKMAKLRQTQNKSIEADTQAILENIKWLVDAMNREIDAKWTQKRN